MLRFRMAIPLFAAAVWMITPAEATTSYYTGSTGETLFNAAVGGLTLLDPALTFSSSDLSPGAGLFNASGTGIDFLGFDTAFSFDSPLDFTVTSGKLVGTPAELIKINFPAAGVYAFGIHVAVVSGSATWCVDLTPPGTCANSVFDSSSADVQFFGFVSPIPVAATLYFHPLTLTGNPAPVLTNFEAFGAGAPAVPESRTILLVGLGLTTLLLRRKQYGLRRGV